MLALPDGVGRLGLVLLAVGAVAALVVAWRTYRSLAAASAPGGARCAWVPALVAASLGLAVAVAPFSAWRIVQDFRYTSRIDPFVAERIGAYENFLDATLFDDLIRRIPPGDRYYVRVSPAIEPDRASHAFRVWALTALLPRRAVTNPGSADWIVTWGVEPRSIGAPTGQVWRIREPKYGFPAAYLAKVAP